MEDSCSGWQEVGGEPNDASSDDVCNDGAGVSRQVDVRRQ